MNGGFSRASVYRGAATAVAMQWSLRLIGLVSVVILARLLSPADFGLVGLAVAALAFVELLGAVGLRQALLRLEAPERADLDTAWTIQLILCCVMGLVSLAAAPLIAGLYGAPELGWVVAALSARYVLLGLVNIGVVEFDRNLQFGRDMRMRLTARFASLAATIAAAVLLRSYWALVAGLLCQSGFLAIASWALHPYRPRLSLARRAELLGPSLWLFVHTLAQTVQQQVERLVLGLFTSAHLVGLFSVSKDLSEMFTQEISTALNRVTFVTVARGGTPLSAEPGRVGRILGSYALIAAPMGLGLAATAPHAVAVLLGPQWGSAVPLLQVVALYSALFAVYKAIASALQAAGEAKRVAGMSSAGAMLLVAAVGGTALVSPEAMSVAWAAFAANLFILLGGILFIARRARARLGGLFAAVARPFAAAAGMWGLLALVAPETGIAIVDLAASAALGALAYPLLLAAIWLASGRPDGAESEGLDVLRALRARARRRPLAPK